jgi:antitoxin PrlF
MRQRRRVDGKQARIPVRSRTVPQSTLTTKGRTTVPAEIRALVGAKAGTRLVWSVTPDGTIIVRAKTKSILELGGMLKALKGKPVRIKKMIR